MDTNYEYAAMIAAGISPREAARMVSARRALPFADLPTSGRVDESGAVL